VCCTDCNDSGRLLPALAAVTATQGLLVTGAVSPALNPPWLAAVQACTVLTWTCWLVCQHHNEHLAVGLEQQPAGRGSRCCCYTSCFQAGRAVLDRLSSATTIAQT